MTAPPRVGTARAVRLLAVRVAGERLILSAEVSPPRAGEPPLPDRLVLRERGTGRAVRIDLTSDGGSGLAGTIEPRDLLSDSLPMSWDVGTDDDGHEVRSELDPLLTPSAFLPVGDRIHRVRPHGTRSGHVAVTVDVVPPHAEITRVLVDDDGVVVEAELARAAGAPPAGPVTLVASSREREREVTAPAEVDGTRARGRLPLAALDTDVPGTEYWDLYLRSHAGARLRLAGYLDGVPNKKKAVVYPMRELALPSGKRSLQPYFTINNGLSVRSKPPGPSTAQPAATKSPARRPMANPRTKRLKRTAIHFARALALRLARTAVRRVPTRRAVPAVRNGRVRVSILVMHGYGMGGTVRTVFNLASYLSRDHDVEVVSQVRERREPFFALPPGVTLTPLEDRTEASSTGPARWLRNRLSRLPSLLVHEADNTFARSTLWTDVQLVRRFRAQRGGILITTRPSLNLLAAQLAAPDVITVAQEHLEFGGLNPVLAKDLPRSYRSLDALAVLTQGDLEDWAKALAGSGTRIVRIPNILTPLTGGLADPASKVVVAAGRLTGPKGFHLLIRAFEQVVADHPDWSLRIYGSGAQGKRLRQMIVDRGLYNDVLLMGRADRMGDELAKASVFALSSRSEGFGMVIIEAMSKGLAVVSFDCPRGPREIITDGEDGILVPNGNVDALAAALRRVIEDEDERRRLGAAGLRTAERYGPDAVGREWDELFGRLLAERAPSWWPAGGRPGG